MTRILHSLSDVIFVWESYIQHQNQTNHYIDVIMTTMASQITSLTVVYSTVYSDADQRKHQSSASLAFVWGIHRDRWIPRTKGQLRGKCIHLMTSSWIYLYYHHSRCIFWTNVFILFFRYVSWSAANNAWVCRHERHICGFSFLQNNFYPRPTPTVIEVFIQSVSGSN